MTDYQIDPVGAKTGALWRTLAAVCLLLVTGCTHWQAIADQDHLFQREVTGTRFPHRLLWNAPAQARLDHPTAAPAIWHLYIEGDGHAVTAFHGPSRDPTPLTPILLPALAADRLPALYLGRPCYWDTNRPPCTPASWTLQRYSQDTVASMAAAAQQLIPPQDRLILIGHSGGGALATLLATRLPQTCAVITLAGNLNVTAWNQRNDYTPLPDSLDPADQPPLPPALLQWHFAGADDQVILPQWIQAFSERQPNSHYVELPATAHIRPWQRHLLNSLKFQQNQNATRQEDATAPLVPALDNSQSVCGKVTE